MRELVYGSSCHDVVVFCVSELTVPLFVTLLHKMTEQVSSQYLFIKGIVMLCFITVYIKFPCYNRVGNGGRKLLFYKESYAYKKNTVYINDGISFVLLKKFIF